MSSNLTIAMLLAQRPDLAQMVKRGRVSVADAFAKMVSDNVGSPNG